MALSDETDPRRAMVLILDDNATDSDFANAGSQPDYIEVVEASPMQQKATRSRAAKYDALYCWRPAEGSLRRFSADGGIADRTQTVRVECFSATADGSEALKEDVLSIAASHAIDNKASTAFTDIFPTGEVDNRNETGVPFGDAFVSAAIVTFRRDHAI